MDLLANDLPTDGLKTLLDSLSAVSTLFIAAALAVHLFAFLILWMWWRRDLRSITSSLDDFTRGLRHRSVLGSHTHLSDQIDAFLADVRDVIDGSNHADRELLTHRIKILDERRHYLGSMLFETSYNICRTMIEAYPLLGVLGTILAIGAALHTGDGEAASVSVNMIVGRFGEAIWSTFAGLVSAVLLMFLNSSLEPRFQRLAESRTHVRETVARAKRELSLNTGSLS